MLYLGIDQHARQITVSLRDDHGDVLLARQVSTQPEKIRAFFQQLTRERLRADQTFVAVLEVCGFNDWLIGMLHDYRCHKVILIQPEERKLRKTDRRDAAALSELLWVNRERLLQGKLHHASTGPSTTNGALRESKRLKPESDRGTSHGTPSTPSAPALKPGTHHFLFFWRAPEASAGQSLVSRGQHLFAPRLGRLDGGTQVSDSEMADSV